MAKTDISAVTSDQRTGRTPLRIWFCLIILVLFWSSLSRTNWVHNFYDYPGYVERAKQIRWDSPETLYNKLKPLGYPVLIRIVNTLIGDYRITGAVISLVSALLCLLALETLWRRFGLGPWTRTVVLLLVGLESFFVRYTITPGTDMLNMPIFFALALVFCSERWRQREILCTGLLIGLAFLNRYRMAFVLLAPTIRLLFSGERMRSKVSGLLLLLAGFLSMATPQLLVNTAAKGSPFPEQTFLNVAIYLNLPMGDQTDIYPAFARGLYPGGARSGVWLLGAYAGNFFKWIGSLPGMFGLFPFLLVPGIMTAWRGSRGWSPVRSYLLLNAVLCLNLFIIPPIPRFAFPIVPAMVLFPVWFVAGDFLPSLRISLARRRCLATVLASASVAWLAFLSIHVFGRMSPHASRNIEIENVLQERHIDPTKSVLQFGTAYYHATDPVPLSYPAHDADPPSYQVDLETLKNVLRRRHLRFALIGSHFHHWKFPHLIALMDPQFRHPEFERIALWTDFPRCALYRFIPRQPTPPAPDSPVPGEIRPQPESEKKRAE